MISTVEMTTDEQIYCTIGRFIFECSKLEFMIREALGSDISGTLFDVLTAQHEFPMVCRTMKLVILLMSELTEEEKNDVEELFSECLSLNEERDRVVHSTWNLDGQAASTMFVLKSPFEASFYLEKLQNLQRATTKATTLLSRFRSVLTNLQDDAKKPTLN